MAVRRGAIPSDFHVQSQKFKTFKLNFFDLKALFMKSYDKLKKKGKYFEGGTLT